MTLLMTMTMTMTVMMLLLRCVMLGRSSRITASTRSSETQPPNTVIITIHQPSSGSSSSSSIISNWRRGRSSVSETPAVAVCACDLLRVVLFRTSRHHARFNALQFQMVSCAELNVPNVSENPKIARALFGLFARALACAPNANTRKDYILRRTRGMS